MPSPGPCEKVSTLVVDVMSSLLRKGVAKSVLHKIQKLLIIDLVRKS